MDKGCTPSDLYLVSEETLRQPRAVLPVMGVVLPPDQIDNHQWLFEPSPLGWQYRWSRQYRHYRYYQSTPGGNYRTDNSRSKTVPNRSRYSLGTRLQQYHSTGGGTSGQVQWCYRDRFERPVTLALWRGGTSGVQWRYYWKFWSSTLIAKWE